MKNRISDLGEARSLKPFELSVFHERSAEQLFYTAPEMTKGLHFCGPSTDVYSFGNIAAEVMNEEGLSWDGKAFATGYGLSCLFCQSLCLCLTNFWEKCRVYECCSKRTTSPSCG